MWFIGDIHGRIQQYRNIIRELPEGSKSIQVGDMGLGFKGVKLFPGGSLARGWHRFIRGNHDSPQHCYKHPLYLGDWGYLPEEQLFYLGGAWSIDQKWRTEGVSWWRDEELSHEQLQKAMELYVQTKPQIVITHEAPTKAAMFMLQGLLIPPPHEPCPTDNGVRMKGQDYRYYKSKMGCMNTRTSQVLQQMLEVHQPRCWIFGHYHVTHCFKLGDTEFQCLGELATREINLEKSA